MSYFPADIPFMSDEELIENGLKKPYKKPEIIDSKDLVPVVRCKDCKHVHCRIYHGWQEPIYTCTHLRSRWNTDNDLEVNPDGFCSYGEKGGEE